MSASESIERLKACLAQKQVIRALVVAGITFIATVGISEGDPVSAQPSTHGLLLRLVDEIGPFTAPPDAFVRPARLRAARDGALYVVDVQTNRVQRFLPDGTLDAVWGGRGSAEGRFLYPMDLAFAPDGSVYVVDSGNHRVQRFGPRGSFLTAFGEKGDLPGQFESPLGIGVGPDGRVYVADSGNHRVQVFDPDGNFLGEWGGVGKEDGQFASCTPSAVDRGRCGPSAIAVAPDGAVYVNDPAAWRIQKFRSDGRFRLSWGGRTSKKELGQFGQCWSGRFSMGCAAEPTDLAIDASGMVLALDRELNRVQRFDASGAFIDQVQVGETRWIHPRSIAVDSTGDLLALAILPDTEVEAIVRVGPEGLEPLITPAPVDDSRIVVRNMDVRGGKIYAFDWRRMQILGLDRFGVSLSELNRPAERGGPLSGVMSLSVRSDGTVWASDDNGSTGMGIKGVVGFDADGGMRELIEGPLKDGSSLLGSPIFVGALDDGRLVIADFERYETGRQTIQRWRLRGLRANRTVAWTFVGRDRDPGRVRGLAVDREQTAMLVDGEVMRFGHTGHRRTRMKLPFPWKVDFDRHIGVDPIDIAPDGALFALESEPYSVLARIWRIPRSAVGDTSAWNRDAAEAMLISSSVSRRFAPCGDPLDDQNPTAGPCGAGSLAVGDDNLVYVGDTGASRILVYGSEVESGWRTRSFATTELTGSPLDGLLVEEISEYRPPAAARSIRMRRELDRPNGRYSIRLKIDGGARLWLGEELLLDEWRSDTVERRLFVDLEGEHKIPEEAARKRRLMLEVRSSSDRPPAADVAIDLWLPESVRSGIDDLPPRPGQVLH